MLLYSIYRRPRPPPRPLPRDGPPRRCPDELVPRLCPPPLPDFTGSAFCRFLGGGRLAIKPPSESSCSSSSPESSSEPSSSMSANSSAEANADLGMTTPESFRSNFRPTKKHAKRHYATQKIKIVHVEERRTSRHNIQTHVSSLSKRFSQHFRHPRHHLHRRRRLPRLLHPCSHPADGKISEA